MSLFGKYDRNFGTNRKLRRCGSTPLERATAQLVLLQLDAEHLADLNDGLVSASRAHPEQLAISLASFGFEPEQCEAALASLQEVGIIERYSDGSVQLVKWKEWSTRPLSDVERKRRSRGKQPDEDGRDIDSAGHDESPAVTNGHDESRSVTTCPASQAKQSQAEPSRAEQSQAEPSTSRPVTGRDVPGAPPPEPPVPGQPAAPDPQSAATAAPEALDPEIPAVRIADVLLEAGFGNPRTRWRAAVLLGANGMTGDDARELWRLAQSKGKEPVKLLSHWIAENLWRAVLDEQRMKRKERAARQRGRKARAERGEDFPVEVSEP